MMKINEGRGEIHPVGNEPFKKSGESTFAKSDMQLRIGTVAKKLIDVARAPQRLLSFNGGSLEKIQLSVSSEVKTVVGGWKHHDFESENFHQEIHGLIESLLGNHRETTSSSRREHDRMADLVFSDCFFTIYDSALKECTSKYVAMEGDVSHLEDFLVAKLHALQKPYSGQVSKRTLYQKSYEHGLRAVAKQDGVNDPVKLSAKLESKGLGKTLDKETKSRLAEGICKELATYRSKDSKLEKGSARHVSIEKNMRLAQKAEPLKENSPRRNDKNKEEAHREEATKVAHLEEERQGFRLAKEKTEKRNEEIREEKSRDRVKDLKER